MLKNSTPMLVFVYIQRNKCYFGTKDEKRPTY